MIHALALFEGDHGIPRPLNERLSLITGHRRHAVSGYPFEPDDRILAAFYRPAGGDDEV
jgi:hypothetical protein